MCLGSQQSYDLSDFHDGRHGCSSRLFCQFQTHCLGTLSYKSLAPLQNWPKFEFVEELEAMPKKIACDGEETQCKFTSVCMRCKYFVVLM